MKTFPAKRVGCMILNAFPLPVLFILRAPGTVTTSGSVPELPESVLVIVFDSPDTLRRIKPY